MLTIEIPGYRTLHLQNLLLDYNGTIAIDGVIPDEVKERLRLLSRDMTIYVLTADTHGNAANMCAGLPVTLHTFPEGSAMQEKHRILRKLDESSCAAIGNGRNDVLMCRDAALSIAVIGPEGAHGRLISDADVCVTTINEGLDLLLKPKRLIASLRV